MERILNSLLLLVLDFDNTVANTSLPSPNNIGLNEAHELAIYRIFGRLGLQIYKHTGGLRNQSPMELMAALIQENHVLIKVAKSNHAILDFSSIHWEDSDALSSITNMFVKAKMDIYNPEIGVHQGGQIWPEPCQGFISLLEKIKKINETEKIIDFAVLSAGHTQFIQRTFLTWGYDYPHVILSDDETRHLDYPLKLKTKPSPLLLLLVQKRWAKLMHLPWNFQVAKKMRERIIYFGDDRTKDGELAQRAGVPFGWFTPKEMLGSIEGGFRFSDWRMVADRLEDRGTIKSILRKKSVQEIFGIP